MRRILSIISAVCLLSVVLTGCGAENKTSEIRVDVSQLVEPNIESMPQSAAEPEASTEETSPEKEHFEDIAIPPLPDVVNAGEIMSRVLLSLQNEKGIVLYTTISSNPEFGGAIYEAEGKTILNNETGELGFYYEERYAGLGDKETSTTSRDETYVVLSNDPEHKYTTYTRHYYKSAMSDSESIDAYQGYKEIYPENRLLILLMMEPYVIYNGEIIEMDGQEYYVLTSNPDLDSKVAIYVNKDTFQLHSAKVYVNYVSDTEYGQLTEMTVDYVQEKISVPVMFNNAELKESDDVVEDFEGFFNLTEMEPIQENELCIHEDGVEIGIGDTAEILFDTQFSEVQVKDVTVLKMSDLEGDGITTDGDGILQPDEIALCVLSSDLEDITPADFHKRKAYSIVVYNPTFEPIAIRDGTISAIAWGTKFIRDKGVNDLSFFDFKALFGTHYETHLSSANDMHWSWDFDDYVVWVEWSLWTNVVVVQDKNGPDILQLTMEQN